MSLLEDLQGLLQDPITYELMDDAVVSPYGHSFSFNAIRVWLAQESKCPVTQQYLTLEMLRPNYAVRDMVKFVRSNAPKFLDWQNSFGSISEADRVRERRKQCELEYKVTQQILTETKEKLSQKSRLKTELFDETIRLEEEIERISPQLNAQGEVDLQNSLYELELSEKECSQREEQLASSIARQEKEVDDISSKLKTSQDSFLPSFLSGEKVMKERLQEIQENLLNDNKKLLAVRSRRQEISLTFSQKKAALDELHRLQQKPKSEVWRLQASLEEARAKLSRLDKSETRLLVRVNALSTQLEELEVLKEKLSKEMNAHTSQMRVFLEEASRFHATVDAEYDVTLASVRLKEDGNEKYNRGKYSKAIDLYTRAIEIRPDPSFYLNRAAAFTQIRQYQNARNDIDACLAGQERMSPDVLGKCYRRMATTYYKEGRKIEAMQWTSKALGLDPADKQALDLMALIEVSIAK